MNLPSTENLPTRVLPSRVTSKKAKIPVNTVQIIPTESNKKMFSLTTGFSIRRNVNNTENPYTLTLISKPLESFSNSRIKNIGINNSTKKHHIQRIQYGANSVTHLPETKHTTEFIGSKDDEPSALSGNNFRSEIIEDEDVSIYLKPQIETSTVKSRTRSSTIPTTTTKYYLKTVLKRPVPLNIDSGYSTENIAQNEELMEINNQNEDNHESDLSNIENSNNWKDLDVKYNEPIISSYKSLDNLSNNDKDTFTNYGLDLGTTSTTVSSTSTTSFPSTTPLQNIISSTKPAARKPSYYLYHVEDDVIADQTTEVFSNKVKNVFKSFIDNLSTSSVSNFAEQTSSSLSPDLDDKVVNIGFLKKKQHFTSEKPLRSNIKHVKIITEPNIIRIGTPTADTATIFNENNKNIFSSSTKPTSSSITELPYLLSKTETEMSKSMSTFDDISSKDIAKSKFSSILRDKSDIEKSRLYQKIVKDIPNISETIQYNKPNYKIDTTPYKLEDVTTTTETDYQRQVNDYISEIVSTTSTTKLTTLKTEIEAKPITKSLSFPTRASRINPAIKLAATKMGGGRRSYQSSSNCSSDNSLQVNTKCNEIKYQRYSPASSLSTLMFHIY